MTSFTCSNKDMVPGGDDSQLQGPNLSDAMGSDRPVGQDGHGR